MRNRHRTWVGVLALTTLAAALATGVALNLLGTPFTMSAPPSPATTPTRTAMQPTISPAACTPGAREPGEAPSGDAPLTQSRSRIINVGFEEITSDQPGRLQELARRLDDVGANAVSIAVGRLDWIGFPWPGHEDIESSDVVDTGRDYVAEAIAALGCDRNGRARKVILGIDVLLGRDMKDQPGLAGIGRDGSTSDLFASVSAWKYGPLKQRTADLAVELAGRYRPDAINITELMFDAYTFGPDDRADFLGSSGMTDWPRTRDGSVDVQDPAFTAWRTGASVGVVAEVRGRLPAGTGLTMDVRPPIDDDGHPRGDIGQDYEALLPHLDRLNVWNFPGMASTGVLTTKELVPRLFEELPDRYALEIGLWSGSGIIPLDVLQRELETAESAGLRSVAVTPSSKMTDEVWATIRKVWVG